MHYSNLFIFSAILVALCFSSSASAFYINSHEDMNHAESRSLDERLTTLNHLISAIVQRLPAETENEDNSGRNFPEMDDRGFDEDVFDEGFGEWEPMRRF